MPHQPVQVPVTTTGGQIWTGIQNAPPTLLIYNPDPVITVYVGKVPQITSNGLNVIPVGPLQSFTVDGGDSWFAVASANGGKNLVIIPGGTNFFQPSRRITAGQFVATGPGSGFFEYIGTGSLGNPPVIAISESTTDPFGNPIKQGIVIVDTNPARPDFIQFLPGSPPKAFFGTGDSAETTPGEIISGILGSGPTRALGMELVAPMVTGENANAIAAVLVQSPTVDLTTQALNVNVTANDGTGNAATILVFPTKITLTGSGLDITTVGKGLLVAEGSNAKQGTAVLVAGTVTVANTSVTANSRIFLTCQVPGGTPGFLRISTRTAGTSFTILSSSATDTSTVAYEIFEPG